MALKRLKTKKSKRMTCRQKYKIQRKVREHNRKVRKEAKKITKKGKKQKLIQIPNICPFKEDILKEVEEHKKRQEHERKQRREAYKLEREQGKFKTLESLVDDADMRGSVHEIIHEKEVTNEVEMRYKNSGATTKEQSMKQYFKEFKKVLENADVVLEVVDARDPLGTRCVEVERAVRASPGNKRLVLILNKADLVPRQNLNNWVKYFRRQGPVTIFKASTQDQTSRFGRKKFHHTSTEKAIQGSVCVGAELLMAMLGNYCRNKGIKTSIRVGVVGIPNVGKSSIINSLTRGKTCSVGCVPGVTKAMQEVELDSNIKLIDCPGIVFTSSRKENNNLPSSLKNAQRITDIKDPLSVAEKVLMRASKDYFCKLYDIPEYDTFEEFFAKKAARMGKFLKKGIPDIMAAARSVINDWNTGKIKYCTQPPVVKEDSDVHVSASIVYEEMREFDVDNFEKMESEVLEKFDVDPKEVFEITSTEPIECIQIQEKEVEDDKIGEKVMINEAELKTKIKKRKLDCDDRKSRTDPAMLLEGNQRLNKSRKEELKKRKKQVMRNEKVVAQIADVLNGSSPINESGDRDNDKYDFDEDYITE